MDPATLLCERCGYVIEGLDERGACPECGKPIAESVPERRTGVPIEPDGDGKVNWWRAAWAVLWRPGETFERVRVDAFATYRIDTRNRLVLFLQMVLWVLLAVLLIGRVRESPLAQAASFSFSLTVLLVAAIGPFSILVLRRFERLGLILIGRGHGWRVDPRLARVVTNYASIGWLVALALPIGLTGGALGRTYLETSYSPHWGTWGYVPDWLTGWFHWVLAGSMFVPLFLFELLCYIGIRRCKFANQPRIRSAEPGAGGSTSVPPASE